MSLFGNLILAGSAGQGPSADLGDTIEQSLRFIGGSQTMQRTFSSTFNASGTLSAWIKVGSSDDAYFFGGNVSGHYEIIGQTSQQFYGVDRFGSNKLANGKQRDYSGWYHICVNFNSGDWWINGQQQTTDLALTNHSNMNNWNIGYSIQGSKPFDGYMAAVIFVDGSDIAETNFGKYNDDGVWVPQDYTGSYGTNGFHLTFDSSQTNGIGHDSSGNGNHFTATGFETTAISSSNFDNDIDYLDTPTSNYNTANPVGTTVSAFTKANLEVGTTSSGVWQGAYGTFPIQSGKWYWEMEIGAADGMIGVTSNHRSAPTYSSQSGEYALRVNGTLYNNGSTTGGYSSAAGTGDIIGVAFDADSGTLWYSINGTWANSATQSEIEAGTTTNSANTGMPDALYVPFFSNISTPAQNYNFGQRPFIYTKPNGYNALDSNKIAEPTIKNGKEHFGVLTYTAPASPSFPITINGSGGNNGTGELDFDGEPDLVWIKMRNATEDHQLFDSVRGNTKALKSHENGAETTRSEFDFATNGFTFSSAFSSVYQQNDSYVAWCWKAGGAAVSNTDGTITSSVSANTDAGFSIVSWTGTDTANQTIGHGLNQAPDMVFYKSRDFGQGWVVEHSSLGNNVLFLHTTEAQFSSATYLDGPADSSVLKPTASDNTNDEGEMIAYCWHSVEGFSKFGGYTGSSGTDNTFVYLGFTPAFLMVKCTSHTGNWVIKDTTRSPNNPSTDNLYANESLGTQSALDIDLLSNGFKIREERTDTGYDTREYIYMAFASNPFGGENAPPATAR